ncbi:zinc transporter 1 isoform X2 [Eurytemora carolleeae]|uniref:zinc transporter 1 isoform X2 n=1 Tax=Eurytemora carolleeae TaxID=1294199 RepID=UPI000C75625D|nr:zinc transporter 1 isoform X2 [Eurytemora carolleeae]|eukprot:XP_023335465.1 zinc transporter 1-like isoform X2 [Eurytemora affinis]
MCDVVEYSTLLHERNSKPSRRQKMVPLSRLVLVLILTAIMTSGELVMAQICHSITLLVLVHQNIYNCITISVACITTKLSRDKSLKNTFGWHRIEVVGSIASLVFLSSLCFATFIEAIQTIFHTDHLDTMHNPDWILLLLAVHIGVWFLAFIFLGGYTHQQNTAVRMERSKSSGGKIKQISLETETKSFKDVLTEVQLKEIARDLQGAGFGLVTCCLVIFGILSEEYIMYIDPVIAMLYITSLIWSSSAIVKESCYILLQTIPGDVEVSLLKKVLLAKYPDILGIHEMHVWTFTPGDYVLSAHIKYRNKQAYKSLYVDVDLFFREHGFKKVTLQPEFTDSENPTSDQISVCSWLCQGPDCNEKRCCKISEPASSGASGAMEASIEPSTRSLA